MNEPEKVISDALNELPGAISGPDPDAIRAIAGQRTATRTRILQTAFAVAFIALFGAVATTIVQQQGPEEVATAPLDGTASITTTSSVTETVPGTFAPDVATPEREPLIPVIPPTASEQPPDTFLMVNEFVVIIEVTGGVERQVATLFDDVPLSQGGRFFESILPLDRNLAIVGLCCEPALGDQSLLNLSLIHI